MLLAGKIVAAVDRRQLGVVGQAVGDRLGQRAKAGKIRLIERQLERRRPQVAGQHVRIIGIDDGMLGRLSEEIIGMAGKVLIDRIVAGQENGQAFVVAAACPPGLLPGAGDRAGITGQQDHVERADVDTQLQGVGRGHTPQLAGEQLALDLASLAGQVAAAVGAHFVSRGRAAVRRATGRRSGEPARLLAECGRTSSPGRRSRSLRPSARPHRHWRCGGPAGPAPNGLGFQRAKYLRPRGAPSPAIAVTGRPISRLASSAGLAIVALALRKTGREP